MDGNTDALNLEAVADPAEAAAAGVDRLGLQLTGGPTKPPALHDGDGWIDFGDAGGSYYYSRTAMGTGGVVYLGLDTYPVDGTAWFDHQWGDFISVGGGGWDWFAVNLDDGTDLTLSLVRDADGSYPLVYGTLVGPIGHDPAPRSGRLRRRGARPLAEPGDRCRLSGRVADHHPGRGADHRPAPDGRRPGARHASDDRRRLLGGLAGRDRLAVGPADLGGGLCRADRLRAVGLVGP